MKAQSEVLPLTKAGVAELLASRANAQTPSSAKGKRRADRWPFPGVVELWTPDENGVQRHMLATSVNLSSHGIGIRCDDLLEPGLVLEIAFHEPELSFHGWATVRHTTKIESDYLIGLEFKFDGN